MANVSLPTVYLETSVISYLTARPSRDLVVAARQQVTHRWWNELRHEFHLLISELVIQEAEQGNPIEAAKRLSLIADQDALSIDEQAKLLAEKLIAAGSLPNKAKNDALHASVCAVNGIDFLVTWNLRHLVNAQIRRKVEQTFRTSGYVPPAICTPEELLGDLAYVLEE
jgi:predicted nucleic acid-binding protein